MNTVAQSIVGATAAVLLLAGCSAVSAEAQGVPTTSSSVTPSATPAPVTAKVAPSPSPSHNPDWGDYTQDEFYIASIAPGWRGAHPTDQQLIAYARTTCKLLSTGVSLKDARSVAGKSEDAIANNLSVTTYAVQVYCPEFTP